MSALDGRTYWEGEEPFVGRGDFAQAKTHVLRRHYGLRSMRTERIMRLLRSLDQNLLMGLLTDAFLASWDPEGKGIPGAVSLIELHIVRKLTGEVRGFLWPNERHMFPLYPGDQPLSRGRLWVTPNSDRLFGAIAEYHIARDDLLELLGYSAAQGYLALQKK